MSEAELLDSLADYVQDVFEQAVVAAVAANSDLDDRVRVVIAAIFGFGRRSPYERLLAYDPEPGPGLPQ